MEIDYKKLISKGSKVYIKSLFSFIENKYVDNIEYETYIVEVCNNNYIKVNMPIRYNKKICLSLDNMYELRIIEYDITYKTRGIIKERYSSIEGDIIVFQLKKSISIYNEKKLLSIDVNIDAEFTKQNSEDVKKCKIFNISNNGLKIYYDEELKKYQKLDIVFPLNDKKSYIYGEVIETLKNINYKYESHISILNMDIDQQEELAKYILSKY